MTNALKIRQKFINLMYLVFILFAFIYAPTNSLDTLFYTTRSMKRATNLMMPENKALKNSLTTDTAFVNQHKAIFYPVMTINDSVESLINRLDSFQKVLTAAGYNKESGYPKYFRSSSMSGKTFIYNGAAEGIRLSVERIKSDLDRVGLGSIRIGIDSLLPTKPDIKNSKGTELEWSHFFFAKTPKAVLLLTTEKIKSDLLTLSRDLLNHLATIRNIDIQNNQNSELQDNSVFVVKLLSGIEVPIKLNLSNVSDSIKKKFFAEVATNKLIGRLEKDGKSVSEATFNQKPMQPQPPRTIVKVENMYAFVGGGSYDELYLGVDNPVDIVFSAPPEYTKDVTVTDGEVVFKDNKYYLRFKKEGYTKVSVYAVKGNNRKLLGDRSFKVILIPNPDVYLSGYKGGVISKDIVKVAKNIDLKNDASNLSPDVYGCESFDVTLIPFDNPIGEIRVRGNAGTSFSAESKELLKNVKRGDVIVLDNFRIRTPEGIVRRIPTVVYRVI